MHFAKIVKFLLTELQSNPSGTSRYLKIAPILGFLVPNCFLGQNSTHINSHFGLDNCYQKGCTLDVSDLSTNLVLQPGNTKIANIF